MIEEVLFKDFILFLANIKLYSVILSSDSHEIVINDIQLLLPSHEVYKGDDEKANEDGDAPDLQSINLSFNYKALVEYARHLEENKRFITTLLTFILLWRKECFYKIIVD